MRGYQFWEGYCNFDDYSKMHYKTKRGIKPYLVVEIAMVIFYKQNKFVHLPHYLLGRLFSNLVEKDNYWLDDFFCKFHRF